MSERIVRIESPEDLVRAWEGAPDVWADIESKSVRLALNGMPRKKIFERTPLSNYTRYRYRTTTARHRKGEVYARVVPGTLRKGFAIKVEGSVTSIGYKEGRGLQYADYQHERYDPEPHYWSPGSKGGWTTPGTGTKFVEGPLTELKDWIPAEVDKDINRRLSEGGL